MLLSKTLVSFLFIAFYAVNATRMRHHAPRNLGKIALSFETKVNLDMMNRHTVASMDRKRVSAMAEKHRNTSINATNALFCFQVSIGVGTPPTSYKLFLDTGSSLTWLGVNTSHPYIRTASSIDTGKTFNISYVGGDGLSGEAYLDTLAFSPDLAAKKQLIGAVKNRTGITNLLGLDGLLGLGPTDLTNHRVQNTTEFPTVLDTLYTEGTISEKLFGVYFTPDTKRGSPGVVTFGGVDEKAILEPIKYAPLTKRHPASRFWAVDHSVSYGKETILSNAAGIVDSGTTLFLLEKEAFQKYLNATGAVMDNSTGFLTISDAQYANLKPLTFHIGNETYELTPNAQIFPRSLNTDFRGRNDAIYLSIGESGSSGSVMGLTFLERFYSVYDAQNKRVGFAKTAYTNATTN